MSLTYETIRTETTLRYCRHYAVHRLNGPALIWVSGAQHWMQYNKCHRENGPAQIFPSMKMEYYLKRGVEYDPEI